MGWLRVRLGCGHVRGVLLRGRPPFDVGLADRVVIDRGGLALPGHLCLQVLPWGRGEDAARGGESRAGILLS